MNRLTKRNEQGVAYVASAEGLSKRDQEIEGSKPILEAFYAMMQKLAAYEETGLEPEEIQDLKDCIEGEEGTQGTVKDLLELMRYRKLEAEGRLIKLPCKPYTKAYVIGTKFIDDISIKEIEEETILSFGKTQYFDCAVMVNDRYEYSCSLEQFGKTVFLTREEAEKALEEMK